MFILYPVSACNSILFEGALNHKCLCLKIVWCMIHDFMSKHNNFIKIYSCEFWLKLFFSFGEHINELCGLQSSVTSLERLNKYNTSFSWDIAVHYLSFVCCALYTSVVSIVHHISCLFSSDPFGLFLHHALLK